MGYTKVKAQKCLLKATNQTEPKGFTSIRHHGWFFSRAGDIYTQKTKTKLEILLSYWICNGCICKWVKIVVIIMELINASGHGHCLPVPIQKSLKILQLLTCKIQPINHLSPYSELCYDCKQSLWKSINQVLEMHQNSAVAASTSTIGSAGNWGCSH